VRPRGDSDAGRLVPHKGGRNGREEDAWGTVALRGRGEDRSPES
jgi:hypothetical protein